MSGSFLVALQAGNSNPGLTEFSAPKGLGRRSRRNDAAVGARVRAALNAGRALAISRARDAAAPLERKVRSALDLDILAGHPERGRAARIARALGITPQGAAKILKRLSSRFYSAR